jgi:hypothetical protein
VWHKKEVLYLLLDHVKAQWRLYDAQVIRVVGLLPEWIPKLFSLIFTNHLVNYLSDEVGTSLLTAAIAGVQNTWFPVFIFLLKFL